MAMTGGTSVLVHTGNTKAGKWVKCYVYYKTSQDIVRNVSTVSTGFYIVCEQYLNIGPWKQVGNSYVGTKDLKFNGAIPNVSGTTWLAENKNFEVKHNSDGTATATIYWSWGVNSSWGGCVYPSGTFNITLPRIPRNAEIATASNFNDEQNPTITYNNPAGNAVSELTATISLDFNTDIVRREIPKTGNSYTFELTSAERNKLREICKNSNSRTVSFYVGSKIGSLDKSWTHIDKTLTIINANPTVSPTVEDTNSVTLGLTGDKNKLIRGYSNAYCVMRPAAYKYATITKNSIYAGSRSSAATSATFNAIDTGTFDFYATDSRGNPVSKRITKTFINYVRVTCNEDVKITVDGKATIEASGNYFNSSFGKVANTLTVQYRYKTLGGNYSGWTSMSVSKSGNSYTATSSLSGLNYKTVYVFEVKAIDKLNTVYSKEKKVKSQPVFDWGENDFNFNVPVNIDGSLTINGQSFIPNPYPVGSIYMSVSSTNPGTLFGGSWTKIEGRFLWATVNTPKKTGGSSTHTHSMAHTHSFSHTHGVPGSAHTHNGSGLAAAVNFDGSVGIYTRWTTARGSFQATGLKKSTEAVVDNYTTRAEGTEVYGNTGSTTPPGVTTNSQSTSTTGGASSSNTGSGSNIPPYFEVYMWYRTA